MKPFLNTSKILLLALLLATGISYASTWTGPQNNTTPPQSNTDAPLNVGDAVQTKTGQLTIDDMLEATGLSVRLGGKITGEAGYALPTSLLFGVNGKIGATEYCDATGANCSTPPFGSGGGSGTPDYESGWIKVSADNTGTITHNLGTDSFANVQIVVREDGTTHNDEVIFSGYQACDEIFGTDYSYGINFTSSKSNLNILKYRVDYRGPCYIHPAENRGNWSSYMPSTVEFRIRIWKNYSSGSGTSSPSVTHGSQRFTTGSGTWTVPAGVTTIKATLIGGGGSGGSVECGPGYSGTAGAGGGALIAQITGLTPGESLSYSVGAGGLGWDNGGVSHSDYYGNNGAATTFNGLTAPGGARGYYTWSNLGGSPNPVQSSTQGLAFLTVYPGSPGGGYAYGGTSGGAAGLLSGSSGGGHAGITYGGGGGGSCSSGGLGYHGADGMIFIEY